MARRGSKRVHVLGFALGLLVAGCNASDQPRAASNAAQLEPGYLAPTELTDAGNEMLGEVLASEMPAPAMRLLAASSDDDAGVEESGDVTAASPHPEGNDLTYACQTDTDCNFGACYVPGTGIDGNPICSKRCNTDADCPDSARCAGPLDCNEEGACEEAFGYCFRACTTDDECTAFNPVDTELDPLEGNPVACVGWVPIRDIRDLSNTPPPAPIDICIEESEP